VLVIGPDAEIGIERAHPPCRSRLVHRIDMESVPLVFTDDNGSLVDPSDGRSVANA
jgi:hypothetical protein